MKTLIIVFGNHRGGEKTWNTMYNFLMQPLNADLALVGNIFHEKNSLCKKAKFLWKINLNQEDLSKSLRNYYEVNFKGTQWHDFFNYHSSTGLGGPIFTKEGSGTLLFALQHFTLKNFLHTILNYDWIIFSRSDHYYVNFHQNVKDLNKNFLYLFEDEKYGGVCERHFVFHSSIANKVLGIADFINDIRNKDFLFKKFFFGRQLLNPERAYKLYFNLIKLKIRGIRRCQFTVALGRDQTLWKKPYILLPGHTDLYLKYENEYFNANENLKLQVQFEKLFSKIFIYDTGHKLIRLGAKKDGGYLVPDILDEIKYLFSPGVSNETSFDEDCYKKKITPFLLDGTIDYKGSFNLLKKI